MKKPRPEPKKSPQPKSFKGNEQNTGQREKPTEYRAEKKADTIKAKKVDQNKENI